MKFLFSVRLVALSALTMFVASASAQDSPATTLLKARSAEFNKHVVKVTDGVYSAIGYRASTINMIVGEDGIIIVDTGQTLAAATEALAEFRKITDKPIKAIILTHSHGDHTGGASVFTAVGAPEIWGRSNFDSESNTFTDAGLTIQRLRGVRQSGSALPADKKINNGVAPAVPDNETVVFGAASAATPNRSFATGRQRLVIAGVTLDLVAVEGETDDALYVWLPEQKVVFSGDNFYKSWPNAYAIRGTPYRDIRSWADANDTMLKEGAEFLVPGHTRPILGKVAVAEALTDYRDGIRFVFDKTIEGINKGMTPDELVSYVKLPSRLADKDYLREYYGNVEWAVRAIFQGYLGWFNGNPTNLFPLVPKEQALRISKLAGGDLALLNQARAALKSGDAQWAAQLCDHLLALDPTARVPKLIKADALTVLAENLLTATGRNYYLTVAQELRMAANKTLQ